MGMVGLAATAATATTAAMTLVKHAAAMAVRRAEAFPMVRRWRLHLGGGPSSSRGGVPTLAAGLEAEAAWDDGAAPSSRSADGHPTDVSAAGSRRFFAAAAAGGPAVARRFRAS